MSNRNFEIITNKFVVFLILKDLLYFVIITVNSKDINYTLGYFLYKLRLFFLSWTTNTPNT